MRIEDLKCGKQVKCPADMGANGYYAKIESYEHKRHRNLNGVEFVWVTVVRNDTKVTRHIWPSHRLN